MNVRHHIFLIELECRHPQGDAHSFAIKNIFYNRMDFRLFLFSTDDS